MFDASVSADATLQMIGCQFTGLCQRSPLEETFQKENMGFSTERRTDYLSDATQFVIRKVVEQKNLDQPYMCLQRRPDDVAYAVAS